MLGLFSSNFFLGCLLPGIVKVYVMTETGQHLGVTHFEYFDEMAKIAKQVVWDPAKQAKLFLKLSEECKLLSGNLKEYLMCCMLKAVKSDFFSLVTLSS